MVGVQLIVGCAQPENTPAVHQRLPSMGLKWTEFQSIATRFRGCCVWRVGLANLLPYQIIIFVTSWLRQSVINWSVACLLLLFFFAVLVPNEPPDIFVEPLFQTVIEGEKVVFRCNASGIPSPSIAWQKMGSYLRNDTLYQNGLLTIDSASSSDAGSYFCKAVNSEGEDSLYVQLEVTGKKQPILLFQKYRNTFNFSLKMKRIWIEIDSHWFKIASQNSDISRNFGLGKSQRRIFKHSELPDTSNFKTFKSWIEYMLLKKHVFNASKNTFW